MKLRGQDAPVELVIAIIILLASMVIALKLITDVGESQCISQLKSEVDKLKLAMQDLSIQSPPSRHKLFFHLPACGGTSVDVVRFVYFNKPEFCRNCPGHFDNCWQLQLASIDGNGNYQQSSKLAQAGTCVDMTGAVQLQDAGNPRLPGYNPLSDCAELSTTPCIFGVVDARCKEISGVPESVLKDAMTGDEISSWRTFGKNYEGATSTAVSRNFDITLTKTTVTGGCGGSECGAIRICVKAITQ
ncbi:MAG: hypothetical protein V1708_01345 [Candidatus Micrarchaeota archaeon]